MPPDSNDKRDWRISIILLAIWAVAMYIVWSLRSDIPLSMMAIASVFFIFLIPAMNDLVRNIEKWAFGSPEDLRNSKEKS